MHYEKLILMNKFKFFVINYIETENNWSPAIN